MSLEYIDNGFSDSELVIGIVAAVGTELDSVISTLIDHLRALNYYANTIQVSKDIIPGIIPVNLDPNANEAKRVTLLMDAGNDARKFSKNNSILALGTAAKICEGRPSEIEDIKAERHRKRHVYIVKQLKHPEEVWKLRQIYSGGFYLLGVYSDYERRHDYLVNEKHLLEKDATAIMKRDSDEHKPYGQRVRDTFHLSDFFLHASSNTDNLRHSLSRVLDILFGHPNKTPTFDEYAMFMASAAGLRSADLSRQVGAVIARNNEILATGANDCPKFGGGLYWPEVCPQTSEIVDVENGRDYMKGIDSNEQKKQEIINSVIDGLRRSKVSARSIRNALEKSEINDITEYGRAVHAEMEAILSCARNNINCKNATLYTTTFPCHNCARHIIAAGIKRVVYVEPYPKSKAPQLHDDSISLGLANDSAKLRFEPFVGIGPRRFFDLFSMSLGSGYKLIRKGAKGRVKKWNPKESKLRIQMIPVSYLHREATATKLFRDEWRMIDEQFSKPKQRKPRNN